MSRGKRRLPSYRWEDWTVAVLIYICFPIEIIALVWLVR